MLGYYGKLKSKWEVLSAPGGEADSLEAVNLIKEGSNPTHPHGALIEDSRFLLNQTGSTSIHIYQQANQSANHLARLGAERLEEFAEC